MILDSNDLPLCITFRGSLGTMPKTDYKFLVAAAISGVCSVAFLIASLGTDYWVSAEFSSSVGFGGSVNHGLFTGRYDRQVIGRKRTYHLTVTCMISDNVCMWSCLEDQDARYNELTLLYETGQGSFSCTPVAESSAVLPVATADSEGATFLQAGLWITTILFISIAILFNILAVGFNVYNIFNNPIYSLTGITGLYIYYAIAACCTTLSLILWGAEYGAYTTSNIAIFDTLIDPNLDVSSTLNYSYFFMLISLLEMLLSLGCIYYREYRINKSQEETVIRVDDKTNDASTFMY